VKKAFSLIELLIVIVIVGVVYTLAVGKLQSVKEEKMVPTLENLKEYLTPFAKKAKEEVRILCLDRCKSCTLYIDTKMQEQIENFVDESVEVYRYTFREGVVRQQNPVYFNEEDIQEDVCFSFTMDRDMISDQVIIAYKERVYDYTGYFTPTEIYSSLTELQEAKEQLNQEVAQ